MLPLNAPSRRPRPRLAGGECGMKRPPSARKSPPKKRGAKKATSISVHSEKQISALVARFQLDSHLLTYRAIQGALNIKYNLRLSVATVYRMGHGRMPKDRATRRALGLIKPRVNRHRELALKVLGILWG